MYLKPCSLNLSNLFSSAVQFLSSLSNKLPFRGLFLLYCRLASRSRYVILCFKRLTSSSMTIVLLTVCHVHLNVPASYVSQFSQHCTQTASPFSFGHCLISLGLDLPQAGQLLLIVILPSRSSSLHSSGPLFSLHP